MGPSMYSARRVRLAMLSILPLAATGCGAGPAKRSWTDLLNGKDFAGWQACRSEHENTWQAVAAARPDPQQPGRLVASPGQGVYLNGPAGRTVDLCTVQQYGDCEVHVEFLVAKGSNSGVYFMGEYEIQILDSYGRETVTFEDCGGIYAYWGNGERVSGTPPAVNACRPAGDWQTYDVVFRAPRFDASGRKIEKARFVSVKQNGIVIHENMVLEACTAGGLTMCEHPRGPLRLQGDHGPVAFRNLRIKAPD